jgi:CheY-like chemotaxis protein
MKVLLADDEPYIHRRLSGPLAAAGHQVLTARNGQEALNLASVERPDVIVFDAVMPVMDGFDALKRLKSDPVTAAIPVVMLIGIPADATPYPAISRRGEFFINDDIDLFVVKPLLQDPSELARALEALVENARPA